MATAARAKAEPRELDLIARRTIPASRKVVWRAWTDAGAVERWWHPKGFGRPTCERMDVRPGGGFKILLPAESGKTYVAWGTYSAVVRYQHLAYEDRCDVDGETFHAAAFEVDFADDGPGTQVTVRSRIDLAAYPNGLEWTPAAIAEGWTRGWEDNLEGLAKQAPQIAAFPGLELVRLIDAPRELVWRAWTDPSMLQRWLCPDDCTLNEPRYDMRIGGEFACRLRSSDGVDHRMTSRVLELVPPERLVFTHGWLGEDDTVGHDTVVTVRLVADGKRTRLHFQQSALASIDDRDSHFEGWSECLAKLAAVAAAEVALVEPGQAMPGATSLRADAR